MPGSPLKEDMKVLEAEAQTIQSLYGICGQGAPPVAGLKGLHVGPSGRHAVDKVLNRAKRCTHGRNLIIELLTQTPYQLTTPMRNRQNIGKPPSKRPAVLGTCVTYIPASPAVQQVYPQYLKGSAP